MTDETVLITGAAGFIGTSLSERLHEQGVAAHAIDRHRAGETFSAHRYHCVDLRDGAAVERLFDEAKPNMVFHLAAQSRVGPSLEDPAGTFQDNVVATLNIASAARRARDCHMLFASSEAVYGQASVYPTSEDEPLRPGSPYAASKVAGEQVVRNLLPDRHTIVRSGMGYGPRSDPTQQVVARFIRAALLDESLRFPRKPPSQGHPTRDINHVHNFLDGIIAAADTRAVGTYNVATGVETSMPELAEAVVRIAGSGRVEHTRDFHYRDGEDGYRICLDINRARRDFGYSPRLDLGAGLEQTVTWWRKNLEEMLA